MILLSYELFESGYMNWNSGQQLVTFQDALLALVSRNINSVVSALKGPQCVAQCPVRPPDA
jgi:hypothetical protein